MAAAYGGDPQEAFSNMMLPETFQLSLHDQQVRGNPPGVFGGREPGK